MSNKYPLTNIRDILEAMTKRVMAAIRTNMETHGRNASFRSVKSLRSEIVGDERAVIYGLRSFIAMERGRKGGKVPKGFVGIIRQWILDKGIHVRPIPAKTSRAKMSAEERGLNTMAYLVARKIQRSGTRLHRISGFDDIFTSAIAQVDKELNKEMTNWANIETKKIYQLFDEKL